MAEQRPAGTPKFADIDHALHRSIERGALAGVVGVAADAEGVIYSGAFGTADVATGSAMSPDSVFWILTMTKAITATGCMQLVEQGRVGVEQPAAEILPDLAWPQVLEGFDADGSPRLRPAKRPITVRHLLTHTSGYTYSLWSEPLSRYEQATGVPIIFSGQKAALGVPLEFDPGERWQYGISIDWIGRIIEAVTGQPLEVYFRENIFGPLGMKDTGFLIGSEQKRRVATTMQRKADGTLTPQPFESPQLAEYFMGGSGLFSTPVDYMAFLQMLVREGSFNGAQILQPHTVAAMLQNQIGELNVAPTISTMPMLSKDFDLFPGTTHKWGFPFDVNEHPGSNGRSAGSAAWAGALNTHYWIDPAKKVTGAILTQVWPFYDDIAIGLFGAFERKLYAGLDRNRTGDLDPRKSAAPIPAYRDKSVDGNFGESSICPISRAIGARRLRTACGSSQSDRHAFPTGQFKPSFRCTARQRLSGIGADRACPRAGSKRTVHQAKSGHSEIAAGIRSRTTLVARWCCHTRDSAFNGVDLGMRYSSDNKTTACSPHCLPISRSLNCDPDVDCALDSLFVGANVMARL